MPLMLVRAPSPRIVRSFLLLAICALFALTLISIVRLSIYPVYHRDAVLGRRGERVRVVRNEQVLARARKLSSICGDNLIQLPARNSSRLAVSLRAVIYADSVTEICTLSQFLGTQSFGPRSIHAFLLSSKGNASQEDRRGTHMGESGTWYTLSLDTSEDEDNSQTSAEAATHVIVLHGASSIRILRELKIRVTSAELDDFLQLLLHEQLRVNGWVGVIGGYVPRRPLPKLFASIGDSGRKTKIRAVYGVADSIVKVDTLCGLWLGRGHWISSETFIALSSHDVTHQQSPHGKEKHGLCSATCWAKFSVISLNARRDHGVHSWVIKDFLSKPLSQTAEKSKSFDTHEEEGGGSPAEDAITNCKIATPVGWKGTQYLGFDILHEESPRESIAIVSSSMEVIRRFADDRRDFLTRPGNHGDTGGDKIVGILLVDGDPRTETAPKQLCANCAAIMELQWPRLSVPAQAVDTRVLQELKMVFEEYGVQVALYEDYGQNGKDRAASSSLMKSIMGLLQTQVGTVTIGPISVSQWSEYSWVTNLNLASLKAWWKPRIKLIVITKDRPDSLSRLLSSLNAAHYLTDTPHDVDLVFNLDVPTHPLNHTATTTLVSEFQWAHGAKYIKSRILSAGLISVVSESWYPGSDNEYAIFLEDDVEVSPWFYVWAKYCVLKYGLLSQAQHREEAFGKPWQDKLFGISLYTPRIVEPLKQRPRFRPERVLAEYKPNTPYLHQLPCSWGALYFPTHWREFHAYMRTRLHTPAPNVSASHQFKLIPGSTTNGWKESWKKFFIELAYLRGYVMLYPNFPNQTSFSTNWMERGQHIGDIDYGSPAPAVPVETGKRKKVVVVHNKDDYIVPLWSADGPLFLESLPNGRLPDYNELPVLDLFHKVSTHQNLVKTGDRAAAAAASWSPRTKTRPKKKADA